MKQLASRSPYQIVLAKIAATITGDPARFNVEFKNGKGYSNQSCYGSVAHYLRRHRHAPAHIMLFGSTATDDVTHCLLVDDAGTFIVNTMPGQVLRTDDGVVFDDFKHHTQHELLASISVANFNQMFQLRE